MLTLAKNKMAGEMCFVMYDSHVDVDVVFFCSRLMKVFVVIPFFVLYSVQVAPCGVPHVFDR